MHSLVRRVRSGLSTGEAQFEVLQEAHEWINRHNARRPKDINWQRWVNCIDSDIINAARILRQGEQS